MRAAVAPLEREQGAGTRAPAGRRRGTTSRPRGQQKLAPEVRRNPDLSRRGERHRRGGESSPAEAGGRRLTLDQLVTSAWEGLLSAGSAPCPVCRGRMELEADTGRCGGCGSRLS